MDERDMTRGVIPVRHASLPGHIKLPRRYEKAAMGTNGISARTRKISIQPGPSSLRDSLSDRLDDLMTAIMWVKQELIMLRQHDVLLKRQFFNIQDSIHSLQKSSASPSTTSNSAPSSPLISIRSPANSCPTTPSTCRSRHSNEQNGLLSVDYYPLEAYFVRPSSSVTVLHEDSEEDDGNDVFIANYFRPRTSSMRTSRDIAALARRRGSKELI